jgi:phage tail sheath gpL-like
MMALESGGGAEIYAIPAADPGGTANLCTITYADGAATTAAASSHELYLFGKIVTVHIPAGSSDDDAATALDAAIKAHSSYGDFPITSGVAANVVTLTAKETHVETKWMCAGIRAKTDYLDSVLTVTVAENATPGATVIDLEDAGQDVIDAIENYGDYFDYIVSVTSDATSLTALETLCNLLESPVGGNLFCQALAATGDTVSNARTLGKAVNAQLVQIGLFGDFQTPPAEAMTEWACLRLLEVARDPATPFAGYPLRKTKGPVNKADNLLDADAKLLLDDGITPFVVQSVQPLCVRSITSRCRTVDAGTVPDHSVLDTSNVDIMHYCCRDAIASLEVDLRVKVGVPFKAMDDPTDGSVPPPFVATPGLVIDLLKLKLWRYYEDVLIVHPESPVDYLSMVDASRSGGRINAVMPIPCIQGLYIVDLAMYQIQG